MNISDAVIKTDNGFIVLFKDYQKANKSGCEIFFDEANLVVRNGDNAILLPSKCLDHLYEHPSFWVYGTGDGYFSDKVLESFTIPQEEILKTKGAIEFGLRK